MSFETAAVMAAAALIGLVILSHTVLRGWNNWLDLKRAELAQGSDNPAGHALNMIDLSDLKERLRKLEAIAAGVDL
ncbi:MAG: hypothetical protein ACKVOL_15130 [Novosphingobium sp.]